MTRRAPSHVELMQLHVAALFTHHGESKIAFVNEREGAIAPRFFLGRTDGGNLWRFRKDLPDRVCAELESLCREEPASIRGAPRHEREYVRILAEHAPIATVWNGPAYRFAGEVPSASGAVSVRSESSHLLRGGFEQWIPEVPYRQPFLALIRNGRAVSVCASVRITAGAHEAGVVTLEAHRRKGYAAEAVSAWAQAVGELGALPLYSTSSENLASRRLAARLAMDRFGDDFHVT